MVDSANESINESANEEDNSIIEDSEINIGNINVSVNAPTKNHNT